MKQQALAAAFCLGATLAFAQAPEAPAQPAGDAIKHKCEPRPEYPGRLAMQTERQRTNFQKQIKTYETCIKAYVEERKAVILANQAAVNAAVEEYNGTVSAINKAQEAAQ